MKVIITKELPKAGKRGEIKEIPNGYANNYLIPNGFAKPATKQNVDEVKMQMETKQKINPKKTEKKKRKTKKKNKAVKS